MTTATAERPATTDTQAEGSTNTTTTTVARTLMRTAFRLEAVLGVVAESDLLHDPRQEVSDVQEYLVMEIESAAQEIRLLHAHLHEIPDCYKWIDADVDPHALERRESEPRREGVTPAA